MDTKPRETLLVEMIHTLLRSPHTRREDGSAMAPRDVVQLANMYVDEIEKMYMIYLHNSIKRGGR